MAHRKINKIYLTIFAASDGLLLGSSYRLKRARSAKSQTSIRETRDKSLLVQDDSSSTHSDDLNTLNTDLKHKQIASPGQMLDRKEYFSSQILKFNRRSGRKSRLKSAQNR